MSRQKAAPTIAEPLAERKTDRLYIRLDPTTRAAVEKAAGRRGFQAGTWVRSLVLDALRKESVR